MAAQGVVDGDWLFNKDDLDGYCANGSVGIRERLSTCVLKYLYRNIKISK